MPVRHWLKVKEKKESQTSKRALSSQLSNIYFKIILNPNNICYATTPIPHSQSQIFLSLHFMLTSVQRTS